MQSHTALVFLDAKGRVPKNSKKFFPKPPAYFCQCWEGSKCPPCETRTAPSAVLQVDETDLQRIIVVAAKTLDLGLRTYSPTKMIFGHTHRFTVCRLHMVYFLSHLKWQLLGLVGLILWEPWMLSLVGKFQVLGLEISDSAPGARTCSWEEWLGSSSWSSSSSWSLPEG